MNPAIADLQMNHFFFVYLYMKYITPKFAIIGKIFIFNV